MAFLQGLPDQCDLTHFLVSTTNFQGRARLGGMVVSSHPRLTPGQVSTFGEGEGEGMLISKRKQTWRIDFELDLGLACLLLGWKSL